MKFVVLLLVVAGFVHATKNVKITSQVVKEVPISKSFVIEDERLKAAVTKAVQKLKTRLDMNIDDVVDEVLVEVTDLFLAYQLDPMQIPEIHLAFEYTPIIITYHGELDLWGGWVQDLITIHRTGASSVSIDGNLISAKIPVGFDDLIITYLYSAKIMDLGPHGSIHGKLYDVSASFDVTIDMDTMTVILNSFSLDTGELGLNFYGYGIVDWLVNLLIDVVEDVLHSTIVDILNKVVTAVVEYIVEYINDLLGRQISFEDMEKIKLTFGHNMQKILLKN